MEEVRDMKKSSGIYFLVPSICLLLLIGIFIYRGFYHPELETGKNAAIEQGEGSGKVDINTADVATLTLIPGIGDITAQKIITYREKYGPFRKIADIKNVSGIGDKTYEAICKYITVGG
jgi:competence ComEA-like helix-hairpin-helix protein